MYRNLYIISRRWRARTTAATFNVPETSYVISIIKSTITILIINYYDKKIYIAGDGGIAGEDKITGMSSPSGS